LLLSFLPLAHAQSGFDIGIGFGSAWDKSIGPVDINTLLGCSSTVSSTCSNTPSLSGFFLGFNGNLMLWKHFGVGGEVNFQPARQNYLTFQQQSTGQFGDVLQSRVTFYDFNGIAQPLATKRASLQFQGGIGGANVKFYEKVSSSSSILGNSQQSAFFGSSNHFQVHAGLGVQLYPTEHVFIRPQIDIHYVTNFTQFGRNAVPEATVWLGYSFGERP
jgi:hypothetical protein